MIDNYLTSRAWMRVVRRSRWPVRLPQLTSLTIRECAVMAEILKARAEVRAKLWVKGIRI